MFIFPFPKKDVFLKYDYFHLRSNPLILFVTIYQKISPKIGNFMRAIKRSRDHVCASADAIASNRSRKTKKAYFYTV